MLPLSKLFPEWFSKETLNWSGVLVVSHECFVNNISVALDESGALNYMGSAVKSFGHLALERSVRL